MGADQKTPDRQFKPGDRVMYKGGELTETPLNQLWTAFGRPHPFAEADVLAILSGALKEYVAAQEALPPETDAETLADGIKGMVDRIAELEQLWLPCDQTIQCAICGWVDWGDTPHSTECPLGYMEAQHRKTAAKAKLVSTVPVEHLHGDLSVTMCRDDCPGCAWERERDALEE